jgi:hypothetical protein
MCTVKKWDIRVRSVAQGYVSYREVRTQVYRCRVFCGLRRLRAGEGGLGSQAERACSRILLHRAGRRGAPRLAGRRRPRSGSPPYPNRSKKKN